MIEPLVEIPIPPQFTALPKADIHIYAEWSPRLESCLSATDYANRRPVGLYDHGTAASIAT